MSNKYFPNGSIDVKMTNPLFVSTVMLGTKSKKPSPPFSTSLFMFKLSKLKSDNRVLPLILSGQAD